LIPELKNGEAIDLTLMNKIISRLNALDDADKFTSQVKRNVLYKSTEDNILIQGFRVNVKLTRDAAGYYGNIGNVSYPTPFADVPVVTVTFDSSAYIVPNITKIYDTHFVLGALRSSASDADIATSLYMNVIAIGASRAT